MQRILSFDVGIVNLSYCFIKHIDHDIEILKWKIIKIPTDIKNIILFLENEFKDILHDIDLVLIEHQPNKNPKMRVIETVLTCFFIMRDIPNTIQYSAKFKLGKKLGATVKGVKNYNQRKKISIEMTKLFLEKKCFYDELKIFLSSKKKDDLADSFLQCLSYLKHDFYNDDSIDVITQEIKIVARKPTEKQEKGLYSRSNLKYMFNNYTKDELKQNQKVSKAISKWYKSDFEKAYNELTAN